MTITRKIGGSTINIKLTYEEKRAAFYEMMKAYYIEDAKRHVECTALSKVLTEQDYICMVADFEEDYNCDYSENNMWHAIIKHYKNNVLKNVYKEKPWGYVLITTEGRLELLDEAEELISYFELDNLSEKKVAMQFDKCCAALHGGDESFTKFIKSSFNDIIEVGKCENGGYEAAKDGYGDEHVNKVGRYYVVVNE